MYEHVTRWFTCDSCKKKCDPITEVTTNRFVVKVCLFPSTDADLCRKCMTEVLTEALDRAKKEE